MICIMPIGMKMAYLTTWIMTTIMMGYSDLQEDWESDPTYGGIFNPLDNSSFPVGATDNDMGRVKR